jgi:hypothetical protein
MFAFDVILNQSSIYNMYIIDHQFTSQSKNLCEENKYLHYLTEWTYYFPHATIFLSFKH